MVLATKTVVENVSPRLVSVQVSLATPLLMSVETGLAYLFGEGGWAKEVTRLTKLTLIKCQARSQKTWY